MKYQQKRRINGLEDLFGSTDIAIGLYILNGDIIVRPCSIFTVAYLSGDNDCAIFTINDLISGEGTFCTFFT